jgi:hypothetical protein
MSRPETRQRTCRRDVHDSRELQILGEGDLTSGKDRKIWEQVKQGKAEKEWRWKGCA